jgi:predicted DNA-binding transcriptional regulator AlpA
MVGLSANRNFSAMEGSVDVSDELVIQKLDELIAVTKAAAIPLDAKWLDASGVGTLISQEPRYVLERLACRADFPRPNRVGRPRWKASEVLQWMEDTREDPVLRMRKPGRKRLPAYGADGRILNK